MATDDDNAREALTTLGVGPAAKELYVDLLRPAAKELGANLQVVARLITHAMTPLHGLVWGLDKVHDWLSAALLERLASVDKESIQTPPPYIAGQILLQLPFCADQAQLRELYANLLASAMQRNLADRVHPAFVQVIQQISPDEALILSAIAKSPHPFEIRESTSESGMALSGSKYVSDQFSRFCEAAGLVNLPLSDAYLDNLLRLKILEEQQWTVGRASYRNNWSEERQTENVGMRLIQVSSFGAQFIGTVLAPKSAGA